MKEKLAAGATVSLHSSRLLRDAAELAGRLKCHIHQFGCQGDGAFVTRRNGTLANMCARVHVSGQEARALAGTPRT